MLFERCFMVAIIFLFTVDAHIIMTKPTPYGADTLNNSPLAANGSDFPCKLRSNTWEPPAEETIATIGEAMPLFFEGSAVHGGGSCQISLTTDLQPTKESEWMVIKSIQGGCPVNADGNLSGGEHMAVPSAFQYSIPPGIEPGKYTLAWTWFNRIGNREMYMNCAPITVAIGNSSGRSMSTNVKKRSSFPPMFVANINGCNTTEGVDIRFPEPGDDVENAGEDNNLAAEGSIACSGAASFGGGSDTGSSTTLVSLGSNYNSGSRSSSSEASSTLTMARADVSYSPTIPANGILASSASSQSDLGSFIGNCTPEGLWHCIGGRFFQRCASGQWSDTQEMAAGTRCTAGLSQNLAFFSTFDSRVIPRLRLPHRGHIHQHQVPMHFIDRTV